MIWSRNKKKEVRRVQLGNRKKDIRKARKSRNFEEKRSINSKVVRIIALTCLTGLGFGAIFLWLPTLLNGVDSWMKSSGCFIVKEIKITGNRRCQRSKIVKALNLGAKELIFTLSLTKAQNRITALPYVKQAVISRRLPNRLEINIVEYKPVALLYLDKLYMVGAEGFVIAPPPPDEVLDYPLICGVNLKEWRKRPYVWKNLLKKATNLLLLWNRQGQQWSEKVAQVVLDEVCGVSLFTTGRNWELQFGFDGYGERLQRWREVIKILGNKSDAVKYFDCVGAGLVVAGFR